VTRIKVSCVLLLVSTVLFVAISTPASATVGLATRLTTLTMDELPPTPADGLTIGGVTFGYQVGGVNSADATFGGGGPGSITFVQDPSLEGGTAGVLTVRFAKPTTVVRFGVALSTFGDLTPGVIIKLFNPGGQLRQTISLSTHSGVSFTEALFNYSGAAVGKIELTFSSAASRFAFDNLTYRS